MSRWFFRVLSIFILTLSIPIYSQHEADNWIFGSNAGLSFTTGTPINTSTSLIPMNTMEGCASISDADGNLLFYVGAADTNNSFLKVWVPFDLNGDGVHDTMPGGNSLIGHVSATQAAIIVPAPGSDHIYYIFTVDQIQTGNYINRGLYYYTVDMTLNAGMGAIVGNGTQLLQKSAEKITAVKSNDCSSIWVITYSSPDGTSTSHDTFKSFQVTSSGVSTTPVSSYSGISPLTDGRGYLKASPQADKIAIAHTGNFSVYLYDFNNTNGVVSNPVNLIFPASFYTYGVEFSKEGKKLYTTLYDPHGQDSNTPNDGFLYQFNLEAANPATSGILIDETYNVLYRSGLQLGPDGKIYRTMPSFWGMTGGSQFLSVINNPELDGLACNYVSNAVDLGIGRSHQGLPPFIQSIFTDNLDIIHNVSISNQTLNLCTGNPYTLYVDDSGLPAGTTYEWLQDGNPIPISGNSLTLDNAGIYNNGVFEVNVTPNDGTCPLSGEANVTYFTQPIANPISNWLVCDSDNNGFYTFDLASLNPTVLGSQNAADFTISYHLSQVHADADLNPIALNYTNVVAFQMQTIYVRIENNACTTCFDTTSFEIDVFSTPIAHPVDDMEICDDSSDGNDTNGLQSFNLTLQNSGIRGMQSMVQYNISYHLSQSDADNDVNALSSPHINTLSPDSQTIYARIENVDHPTCYDTTSFDIVVHPLPVITSNPVALEQCDDDIDGFAPFNLFQSNQLISNDYQNETFAFYLSEAEAWAEINAISNPSAYINPTQPTSTVWANITTQYGCSRVKEVTLIVATTQIPANFLIQYADCDNDLIDNNDANGVIPFDLTAAQTQIEALFPNPQNLLISFYENMADALSESNPIPDLANYQNTNYPHHQFITVRVDSEDYNACLGLGEHIELTVYPKPVMPTVISNYEVCSASPLYSFDLTTKDSEILNGQTDVNITYHTSLATALTGQFPITSPYTNFSNPQTIYVRLENTVTGCFRTNGTFDLVVNELPFYNNVSDFEICDDLTNDGFTSFNLADKTTEILDGQTSISVTYHLSASDAANGVNQIADPYTNISNPQTIYFRMEHVMTHCVNTGSFNLLVNAAPIPTLPTPLEVCDPDSDGFHLFNLHLKDSEIAGALVGQVNVTYHETLTDAQLGITDIPDYSAYYNIDPWSQIIFVRVENITTGCFDTTTLELIVNPTPQINFTPDDMQVCDDNYNGFRQVDLTTHIPEILGGVPLANVQVTFYHSQAEAQAEVNMIVNDIAYTNTSNPETIWVRVEYPLTDCATIVSFDLVINPLPVLSTPDPLELCDNDDDGEDNNGFVQTFMLTDKDTEILNGQTGIVSYHYTQADAQSGSNPIASPFTNTFATVQTLWVRVQFIETGCFATTTLDVRVNPLPTPGTPEPVEACDNDDDGFASFELDAALVFEIQNGEIGTAITFYETYQDALDDVNEITSPYTSISVADGSQIIYARDTYTATGCFRIVEVLLIAQETPQPIDPEDYEVCDDNYDGFYGFDLSIKTDEILGDIDPTTVIVTYHLSQAEADSGSNPIDIGALYTNASNPQTIYVRVESVDNGCFNTVSFDLIVNPIPVVIVPAAMELCDVDPTDGIEMAYFNLESKVAEILNGQVGMIVYFFETLAQAEANDPNDWLVSPYANIENPQTIFVRVQDLNDVCYAITTMDLRVLPTPNANYTPAPLELCDNNDDTDTTNGIVQTFDLNLATADIVNGQVGVSVAYYLSLAGAQNLYPSELIDSNVDFTNTTPFSQTIYAVVTDTLSPLSCSVIIPLELRVNPLPILLNLTDYLFCETDNNNIYLADLHEMDIHLLANTTDLPNVTVTYHLTPADALSGNNPLPNPRILHDGDQLYAHVEFTVTGCASAVGPITITIEQEPRAVQPANLFNCDTAADGSNANGIGVSFDLAAQNAVILDGQTGMTVSFYESSANAELEQNAISSPYLNLSNPQTIYVRVENNVTHCYNFTSFEIGVNDPPHFTLPAPPIVYCLFENPVYLQPTTDGDTYTYQWTNGSTVLSDTAILEVTAAGTYSLTLTTPEGCSETQSVTVDDSQESLLTVADLVLTNFENNNSLTIPTGVQYGIGDYLYSVDHGPFTSEVFYQNLDGGTHTLVIIDQNGCKTHTLFFTILDYMRFFTPNGDGYNDTWNLLGGNTQPGAKIYIFDRFGKLLASIDPDGEGWDGKFNGLPLPSTDYWFSIELEDGTIYKDHFALVRR
jgi:gliding motility-associated-like protein